MRHVYSREVHRVEGRSSPCIGIGNCESTFEAMAESLRSGLTWGLCGFAFWASDIGGFEGMPGSEVYKRWCEWGLLGSRSGSHGSGSYRVPWIYDQAGNRRDGEGERVRSSEVSRRAVGLKLRLMPYMLRCGLATSFTIGQDLKTEGRTVKIIIMSLS